MGEKIKIAQEKILCSAIMYNETVIPGRRHSDCYEVLRALTGIWKNDPRLPGHDQQGFLTSEGRYVNRREAWAIAEAAGQILYGSDASDEEDNILISENLY
jgi:hypothetical protein